MASNGRADRHTTVAYSALAQRRAVKTEVEFHKILFIQLTSNSI